MNFKNHNFVKPILHAPQVEEFRISGATLRSGVSPLDGVGSVRDPLGDLCCCFPVSQGYLPRAQGAGHPAQRLCPRLVTMAMEERTEVGDARRPGGAGQRKGLRAATGRRRGVSWLFLSVVSASCLSLGSGGETQDDWRAGSLPNVGSASLPWSSATAGAGRRLLALQEGLPPSCDAGDYFNLTLDACLRCPLGSWKDAFGPENCTSCPANSTTAAEGGTSVLDCECLGGFIGNAEAGNCTACAVGTFQEGESCSACPAHSTSPEASTNCSCDPGYTGTALEACLPCAADTFKNISGAESCSPCPLRTTSLPGATACSCRVGFYGPDFGPCECNPDSSVFLNVTVEQVCFPAHSFALPVLTLRACPHPHSMP